MQKQRKNPLGKSVALFSFLVGAIISLAADAQSCAAGYRLHYQGFCINIEDELADYPDKAVRTMPPDAPLDESPETLFRKLETEGYKFSNMRDGDYCKDAFVNLSRAKFEFPVAYALGDQSCGFSNANIGSLETAKLHALAECEKQTTNCRLIIPVDEQF